MQLSLFVKLPAQLGQVGHRETTSFALLQCKLSAGEDLSVNDYSEYKLSAGEDLSVNDYSETSTRETSDELAFSL
jgi:hypothetical protein